MISKAVEEFICKEVVLSLDAVEKLIVDKLINHPDSPVKQALDKARWAERKMKRREGSIYQFCLPEELLEFSKALAALEMEADNDTENTQ